MVIKDFNLYYKLMNIWEKEKPTSTTEHGSKEWKKAYKEYYKKIEDSSRLIRHTPTFFYYNSADNYFLIECRIRGGAVIEYKIYKSRRLKTLE